MSVLLVLAAISATYLSIGGFVYSHVPPPRNRRDEPVRPI